MTSITVHKLDAWGREVWTYPGTLLRRTSSSLTLEAFFDRDDADVPGLSLRRGDRFVETFYADRWYNVFAVRRGKTGELKGWYCNLTRPAYLGASEVYAEDLALDVVVSAHGVIHLLDEEEFASLELSEAERQAVGRAVEELRDRVRRAADPFSPAGRPRP
ncbi:MAG TPA: DUF402 domain-containing protein [Anaerolineales bacterium]|nr:DUF402 domain-containing protein [Anaerolineales bacterium]